MAHSNSNRNSILEILGTNYLYEKTYKEDYDTKSDATALPISSSYYIAMGRFIGACTAFDVDFEESEKTITVYTRITKKTILTIRIN